MTSVYSFFIAKVCELSDSQWSTCGYATAYDLVDPFEVNKEQTPER